MLVLYNLKQDDIKTQHKTLYHGSPIKLEALLPRYTERWDLSTRVWHGYGVFATNDRRVALIYTATTDSENRYTHGVDLKSMTAENEPLTLVMFGGKSKEDALHYLYGDSAVGYIYHLDHEGFTHETGLGKMEVVSRITPRIQKIEVINRAEEIKKYVDQGLMKILWQPIFDH